MYNPNNSVHIPPLAQSPYPYKTCCCTLPYRFCQNHHYTWHIVAYVSEEHDFSHIQLLLLYSTYYSYSVYCLLEFVEETCSVSTVHLTGSLADAPAQKKIELNVSSHAHQTKPCHIKGLRERHHRHRRLHPQFECLRPIRVHGIDFMFYHSITKLRG